MTKSSPKSITPIADIVKNVFAGIEKAKLSSKEEIENIWKECAGEKSLVHSRPSALRKKVLYVKVDTSVWMQELSLQKRKILKALKRKLGNDKISDIYFKIGEF